MLLEFIKEKVAQETFLQQYKDQLSLRDLYSAILSNREKFENICPACESDLYRDGHLVVPVDPYCHAEERLRQFDAALKAEERIKEIRGELNRGWQNLQMKVAKLTVVTAAVAFPKQADIDIFCGQASEAKEQVSIEAYLRVVLDQRSLLQELKDAVGTFNVAVRKSRSSIKQLEDDNLSIAKDLEEIIAIATLVAANGKSEAEAKQAIEKFNQENETLIKEVEAEKPKVARNISYSFAYASFRNKLINYNAELPVSLAADLNEKTLKFYNDISKNDHPSDKLKTLTLPTSVGEKISIEYENGEKCDALQVLSEGHIRCLGLAILLAKITRDNLPFLIFDDVVNSIDDEHRSAIIDLILNPNEVGNRQLIANNPWRRLCQAP
ncbi:MAG: hypothetical protein IPK05_04830 [Comamonadaceae bacterium]|nr:hypothetical protein [Comamonadaceae bacterium]